VILTRTTSIVLPPAFTTSRSAARKLAPDKARQHPTAEASSSSLAPCRLLASNSKRTPLLGIEAHRSVPAGCNGARSNSVAVASVALCPMAWTVG
jgi:hypothetical protein